MKPEDVDPEELPDRIQYAQDNFPVTMAGLASRLKVSESTLYKIKSGHRSGSRRLANRLEEVLVDLANEPEPEVTVRVCEICERPHAAHGLCDTCLRAWMYWDRPPLEEFIAYRKAGGRDPRGRKRES